MLITKPDGSLAIATRSVLAGRSLGAADSLDPARDRDELGALEQAASTRRVMTTSAARMMLLQVAVNARPPTLRPVHSGDYGRMIADNGLIGEAQILGGTPTQPSPVEGEGWGGGESVANDSLART